MEEYNDHDLITRAREGDHIAFQTLVEHEFDPLYSLLLGMVGDSQDAEDLVQETIVRCYQRLSTFRGEAAFGTWCTRIAINLAHDLFRRRKRSPGLQDLREVETLWRDASYTVDPEKVALLADERSMLQVALNSLPAIYRLTLLLHDRDGYTVQEIATMANVKVPTAKARLRRARMAMVTYLDRSKSACENPNGGDSA
ncbi:MAG: RNA polymerase sigma factor [Chloroflexota bacterium]